MELSWIQQHVLLVLIREKTARIKDLQPADVEANLFSYHLNGLVKKGHVEKVSRGAYTLTVLGEKYVSAMSTSTNRLTENIKTVILFWAERDGRVLLFRWSRQPYINQVTLPYDRVPIGKSLADGLKSALLDKLGNTDLKTTYVASALIQIKKQNVTVSHMNALVYKVDAGALETDFHARNGEAFWGDLNQSSEMPGVSDFIQELRSGSRLVESTWYYND